MHKRLQANCPHCGVLYTVPQRLVSICEVHETHKEVDVCPMCLRLIQVNLVREVRLVSLATR